MVENLASHDPSYFIEGESIYLREVRLSDVNENYYFWVNDNEVTQYLESRFYPYSIEKLNDYVNDICKNTDYIFMAIVVKDGSKHIGNIKIGPVNWIHRFADVGIMIGEKIYWGKGFGSAAIKLTVDYAFTKLNLHKIEAGCYPGNKGSLKAFKNAGFIEEGVLRQHYFCNGQYVDRICLGITSGS